MFRSPDSMVSVRESCATPAGETSYRSFTSSGKDTVHPAVVLEMKICRSVPVRNSEDPTVFKPPAASSVNIIENPMSGALRESADSPSGRFDRIAEAATVFSPVAGARARILTTDSKALHDAVGPAANPVRAD